MKAACELRSLVFDSLEEQIAVISREGRIVDVNRAWQKFGIENGLSSDYQWIGAHYLGTLNAASASGDDSAQEALDGILDVIRGRQSSYTLEYPCDDINEKRWFQMRVCPLTAEGSDLYVISHHDITQRKLAEDQVRHLASHDPLTGLANRRHFDQVLDMELRRSARTGSPLSLLLVDVDHFKHYNDTLGHLAGDQCLKKVAAVLQTAGRRPTDLAGRIGGDEFALLLSDSDAAGSQDIAEAVVRSVRGLALTYGESGQATVSIGICTLTPHERITDRTFYEAADKALYQAKAEGRSRVARIDPEGTPAPLSAAH